MNPQDHRAEIQEIYRRAYEETPGLERFRLRKKNLLRLVMALFVLQRLLDAVAIGSSWAFLAGLVGLVIPGIFVLAAWRGGWKLSLVLLLPAANGLLSLFTQWIPLLFTGGGYPPLFYAACAVMGILPLTLAVTVFWLTVPEKNRAYGDALNRVHEELIQRGKQLSQGPRGGGPEF